MRPPARSSRACRSRLRSTPDACRCCPSTAGCCAQPTATAIRPADANMTLLLMPRSDMIPHADSPPSRRGVLRIVGGEEVVGVAGDVAGGVDLAWHYRAAPPAGA